MNEDSHWRSDDTGLLRHVRSRERTALGRPVRCPLALAALLALGCTAPAESRPEPGPSDSDTTPDLPPAWSVALTPATPKWNDDLHCDVSGLADTAGLTIRWLRGDKPWTGPTTTSLIAGDTLPHLEQAGGERWSCAATYEEREQTSNTVEILPPYAMTWVPPGSYTSRLSSLFNDDQFTLTRGFLLARLELRASEWETRMGYPGHIIGTAYPPTSGDQPAAGMSGSEAFWFANLVSAADGLDPCYACTGTPPDVLCRTPEHTDVYACEGYRLPTWVEFEYAYQEAGAHEDPLPTGGTYVIPEGYDPESPTGSWDSPVVGPRAPKDTWTYDQCATQPSTGGTPKVVGSLIPNALGLYDMCGNVREWMSDVGPPSPSLHATTTDPVSWFDDPDMATALVAGPSVTTENPWMLRRGVLGYTYPPTAKTYAGIRLARTLVRKEEP